MPSRQRPAFDDVHLALHASHFKAQVGGEDSWGARVVGWSRLVLIPAALPAPKLVDCRAEALRRATADTIKNRGPKSFVPHGLTSLAISVWN